MALHIIIDGYNLIRQSSQLTELFNLDLEMARNGLIDLLAAYKKIKPHKITVVFDGTHSKLPPPPTASQKGILIKYSRTGELADTVIKKMAAREKEKAIIVSSDNEIIQYASQNGASTIKSDAFEAKITMASYMMEKGLTEEDDRPHPRKPTTKKKGPSKRASKKKRRNKTKINKL